MTVVKRHRVKALVWAILILAGAGLCERLRPRTEEEQIQAFVWSVRRAFLDQDFDSLWELQASEKREWIPKSRFVRESEESARLDPVRNLAKRLLLRNAEIWDVEILRCGGVALRADVRCKCSAEDCWYLWLFKEAGEWVLWEDYELQYEDRDFWARRYLWGPRDRKVAGFLPKSPVDPRSVDLVIEVGPSGMDETEFDLLRRVVRPVVKRAGDRYVVAVVDASPRVCWREVIEVSDALMSEEIYIIDYAATGERAYVDTVMVNGTALADLDEGSVLADPAGHAAIRRVIGLGAR